MADTRITRSGSVRDEVLERAFARRDAWAFEAAYRRLGGRLYATARFVTRNDALAQEAVHDVWVRLWRASGSYDPSRGSLDAFLVTCVRNEALARVRNDARREQIRSQLREGESYEVDVDPVESERIARALQRLTRVQPNSVELAYFRGLTFAEVAAELGEPIGTIKSRIASALRLLRRELGEEASHV